MIQGGTKRSQYELPKRSVLIDLWSIFLTENVKSMRIQKRLMTDRKNDDQRIHFLPCVICWFH